MAQIARITRLVTAVDGSTSPQDAPGPIALTDSTATYAIQRVEDGGVVLGPGQANPVVRVSQGVYEYDATYLNLDGQFSYRFYFQLGPTEFTSVILYPGTIASESRAGIRRRVGRLVLGRERFIFCPVTSATTSTVVAERFRGFPDDTLNGRLLHIVSGIGAGQSRVILDSAQSTGTVTVSPWVTVPNSSSVIEVWDDHITPEEVNDQINLAIVDAHKWVNVRVDQDSPVLNAARTEITLDQVFCKLIDVRYYNTSEDAWTRYRPADWVMDAEPLFVVHSRRVHLSPKIPDSITAGNIHVRGYRWPSRLVTDSDLSDVRSDYLTYMAAFYLEAADAEGIQLDPEQHGGRAANWYRLALNIRAELQEAWEPSTQEIRG